MLNLNKANFKDKGRGKIMIKKSLVSIKNNVSTTILVAIPLALVLGYYFNLSFLKHATSVILFFMVYPMMINLKLKEIVNALKKPKSLFISLGFNFLVSPLIAYMVAKVFLNFDSYLVTAMLLIGLIPTSGMSASWTGIAGGKVQNAVIMMSVNLVVSIFMIPIYMQILIGEAIDTPINQIILALVKTILFPMLIAVITRIIIIKKSSEKNLNSLKPVFAGVSSLAAILIIFTAVSLKSKLIISKLDLLAKIFIPIILFYAVTFFAAILLGRFIKKNDEKIPFVFSIILRNLTIALGISLGAFGESLAAVAIAIAYIVQIPIATFYIKLSKQKS